MDIRQPVRALCSSCGARASSYAAVGTTLVPDIGDDERLPSDLTLVGCRSCFRQEREIEVTFGGRRISLSLSPLPGFDPCSCLGCGARRGVGQILMVWHYFKGMCLAQQTLASMCAQCCSVEPLRET